MQTITIPRAPLARRKSLLAATMLFAIAGLCFSLGTALAQDNDNSNNQQQPPQGQTPGMGEHMGHRPMPSVDDQVKHLTQKLDLTDDQQVKLKPILEDQRKQMEQIHSDSSLSREDRFSKMQQVRTASDTQIKALLTADQQKKFDKMREEQRGHMMHGGMGMGGQKPEGSGDQQQ